MSLLLSTKIRERLAAEAENAFPQECCGVLVGHVDGDARLVVDIVACANDADDPRRSYRIDPACLAEALRQARTLDGDVLGVYHSHPCGAARLSLSDEREANGGWSYVVIGADRSMQSWHRDAETQSFCEEKVCEPH